jgi:purine catabolism regulator
LRATLPAFPDLRGGELVLLSVHDALALDEGLTLRNIIARLAEIPVAAIGVVGPVDTAGLEAAVRADLPLLRLPDGVNPRGVERDVMYLLDNRELQIERRAAYLYSHLTHLIASGEGVEAVLRSLSQATGRDVAFYDAGSVLRAKWGSGLLPEDPAVDFARLYPRDRAFEKLNGHPALVKPIGKTPALLGYVAIGGARLDPWDDAAVAQAAAALLLELTKQQAVQAVETRVGGELLQSIVAGTPADMVALQEQISGLGYNLRRPHVALLIAPADANSAEILRERWQQALLRQHIAAPHMLRDNTVLCLYPMEERKAHFPEPLEALANELPIGAGMSNPSATVAGWQRAYGEAEQALTLGRRLFGARSLTSYRDLRVYRLLFEMRSSPELWSFYTTTLGPLIEYDRKHNAALLETLEGYFAARGNLSQSAERLQIHRNTLLYRLRRINQIGGIDLERSEDMLALQVALKAHRVIASATKQPEMKA